MSQGSGSFFKSTNASLESLDFSPNLPDLFLCWGGCHEVLTEPAQLTHWPTMSAPDASSTLNSVADVHSGLFCSVSDCCGDGLLNGRARPHLLNVIEIEIFSYFGAPLALTGANGFVIFVLPSHIPSFLELGGKALTSLPL